MDTNCVADFLLVRSQWLADMQRIISLTASYRNVKLFCSSITIGTVYYLLTRQKLERNFIVDKLKQFRLYCDISLVDSTVIDAALDSMFVDLEDAIQHFSAVSVGCDVIVTRNKKDFVESKIPIMTPQEFLEDFCEEE